MIYNVATYAILLTSYVQASRDPDRMGNSNRLDPEVREQELKPPRDPSRPIFYLEPVAKTKAPHNTPARPRRPRRSRSGDAGVLEKAAQRHNDFTESGVNEVTHKLTLDNKVTYSKFVAQSWDDWNHATMRSIQGEKEDFREIFYPITPLKGITQIKNAVGRTNGGARLWTSHRPLYASDFKITTLKDYETYLGELGWPNSVFDLGMDSDREATDFAGFASGTHVIDYYECPIEDFSTPSGPDLLETAHKIVEKLRNNDRVLIYCKAGEGRSGMMVEAVLGILGEEDIRTNIRKINRRFIDEWAQGVQLTLTHTARELVNKIESVVTQVTDQNDEKGLAEFPKDTLIAQCVEAWCIFPKLDKKCQSLLGKSTSELFGALRCKKEALLNTFNSLYPEQLNIFKDMFEEAMFTKHQDFIILQMQKCKDVAGGIYRQHPARLGRSRRKAIVLLFMHWKLSEAGKRYFEDCTNFTEDFEHLEKQRNKRNFGGVIPDDVWEQLTKTLENVPLYDGRYMKLPDEAKAEKLEDYLSDADI